MEQKQKTKFRNYFDLALFGVIGILLCLTQCGGPKVTQSGSNETKKADTVIVTKIVPRPYEVVKFKTIKYPKPDIVTKIDTVIDGRMCQWERTYNDSLVDSNISIYSKVETIGMLKSNDLSYRLKTPLKVIETKEITNTVTKIQPNRFSVYTGMELSGNETSFNASPFVTLNVKKVSLTAGYGLIDKTYKVGVGVRLFKSKK